MTELSGGIEQPKESKLCYFVLIAFSQLCYLTGSREMRSMAVQMPFELHYTARALVSLMQITGRASSAAKALANQMHPPEDAPGKPEPFTTYKNVSDWIAYKLDVVGDSGLMFHPSWDTPGVIRAADGTLKSPPGWTPSVADLFDLVKRYQTITGPCDMIA